MRLLWLLDAKAVQPGEARCAPTPRGQGNEILHTDARWSLQLPIAQGPPQVRYAKDAAQTPLLLP